MSLSSADGGVPAVPPTAAESLRRAREAAIFTEASEQAGPRKGRARPARAGSWPPRADDPARTRQPRLRAPAPPRPPPRLVSRAAARRRSSGASREGRRAACAPSDSRPPLPPRLRPAKRPAPPRVALPPSRFLPQVTSAPVPPARPAGWRPSVRIHRSAPAQGLDDTVRQGNSGYRDSAWTASSAPDPTRRGRTRPTTAPPSFRAPRLEARRALAAGRRGAPPYPSPSRTALARASIARDGRALARSERALARRRRGVLGSRSFKVTRSFAGSVSSRAASHMRASIA